MIFAGELRKLMALKGHTQVNLADALDVAQSAVSNYLRGRLPRVEILHKIAKIYGVSIANLMRDNALPGYNPDYVKDPDKYKTPLREFAADMDAAKTDEDRQRAHQSLKTKTLMQSEREDLREQRDAALAKIEKLKRLLKEALAEL